MDAAVKLRSFEASYKQLVASLLSQDFKIYLQHFHLVTFSWNWVKWGHFGVFKNNVWDQPMFQVYFENLEKRHEKILSSNEYGDTTTWIIKLIEMHNQHHIESNETIEKSQKLFHFGNSISSFGSDSVMPKVNPP